MGQSGNLPNGLDTLHPFDLYEGETVEGSHKLGAGRGAMRVFPLKATFPAQRGMESPRVSGNLFGLMPELHALLFFRYCKESCLVSAPPSDRKWTPGNRNNNR